MKIIISCCGGNTSNVLAAKLRVFLKNQGIDLHVKACAELNIERHLEEGDILLIAPQNYLSDVRIASIQKEYKVTLFHIPYEIFADLDAKRTYALIQQGQIKVEEKQSFSKGLLNRLLDMNKLPVFDRLQRSFRSLFKPTMIGMLANLLLNLPLGSQYQAFITSPFIAQFLTLIITLTIQSASLYFIFTWGYQSTEGTQKRRFFHAFVCLACFFFSMPANWLDSYMEYAGIQALFVALIVGIIVTSCKTILDKNIHHYYPQTKAWVHDVLWIVILPIIFVVMNLILQWIGVSSLNELVSTLINVPLQKLAGSWNTYIFLIYITIIPWFFGIHGGMFINTVFIGLYTQAVLSNMEAYIAGLAIPFPMYSLFIWISIGGTGCTLALNLLMLRAKSKKLRKNGRQSLLTSIFNINEPLIFGAPIAYNIILFLPFVIAPTINSIITYVCVFVVEIVAMPTGLIDTMGFLLPIGVNALISTQSISGAILSLVLLLIDILIYYPFFHRYDESIAALEDESCHNQK